MTKNNNKIKKVLNEVKQEVAAITGVVVKKVRKARKNRNKKNNPGYKRSLLPSYSDAKLCGDVHEAINSFFFPSLGVHRGQAKAFSNSALALLKGSIITTNSTAANNIFAYAVYPNCINQAGWLNYGYGTTPAAALTNPVASILSSTQAVSYRIVSFEMILTPQGSFTNQAGSGLTGYVPDGANFTFTSANVANLALNRPFKGVDTPCLHWLPSENTYYDETEFQSIAIATIAGSALYGFVNIPAASDQVTTWQIDYQVGVEYIPSTGYRPFVEKMSSTQDIRCMAEVSQFAEKHWRPLMIGTLPEYQAMLSQSVARDGGRFGFQEMTHLGPAGSGFATLTRDKVRAIQDDKSWFQHVKEGDFAGATEHAEAINKGVARSILNAGIGVINYGIPGTEFDLPYIGGS